jgi:hypothetical protein
MENEILNFKFLAFRKLGITIKKIISKKNFTSYIKSLNQYNDYWNIRIDRIINVGYKIINFHIKYNSPPHTKYFNQKMPFTHFLLNHMIDLMYMNNEFDEIEECFKILFKMGKDKIRSNIDLEYRMFTALMYCEKSTIRNILNEYKYIREMDHKITGARISTLLCGKKDEHIVKLCESMNFDRKKYIELVEEVFRDYNCPKRFQLIKEKLLN